MDAVRAVAAIAATYNFNEGIRITRHSIRDTGHDCLMLDDDEWVSVFEVAEDLCATVAIIRPEDVSREQEIADDIKTALWTRLAGYGIL